MAFIKYVELPEGETAPDPDNILRIHNIHPEVMRRHYELYFQLMYRPGPLSRPQREMLAVRVSVLNHCHY